MAKKTRKKNKPVKKPITAKLTKEERDFILQMGKLACYADETIAPVELTQQFKDDFWLIAESDGLHEAIMLLLSVQHQRAACPPGEKVVLGSVLAKSERGNQHLEETRSAARKEPEQNKNMYQ